MSSPMPIPPRKRDLKHYDGHRLGRIRVTQTLRCRCGSRKQLRPWNARDRKPRLPWPPRRPVSEGRISH